MNLHHLSESETLSQQLIGVGSDVKFQSFTKVEACRKESQKSMQTQHNVFEV